MGVEFIDLYQRLSTRYRLSLHELARDPLPVTVDDLIRRVAAACAEQGSLESMADIEDEVARAIRAAASDPVCPIARQLRLDQLLSSL